MTVRERNVVQALEQAIIQRIGEPRYKLWFEGRTRFRWDDDQLTVGVPNRHFGEWVEKNFGAATASAAQAVFGRAMQVRFVIDPELFQAARREQDEARQPSRDSKEAEVAPTPKRDRQATEKPPLPDGRGSDSPRRVRRWRRLSDFIVGPCNRVAYAAAQSVVEEPGEGANPIVLHGPVGTGKTHLLEGIYAGLRRAHPDWRVLYLTSEDFTNRFVQAMRLNKLAGFRRQFRECDALLVDDLHFLASKKATQAEFLHTFDALQADGRQMVLTCDCHPRLADDFTPELTDRLLGGVIWGLTPPDATTRLEILRNKSLQRTHAERGNEKVKPLPDDVLRFLAGQLRGNVRELEGALQSICHYSRVTSRAVDVSLVREALADLLRHAVRVVQLADIDGAVCAALRLEHGILQSKGRAWAVSHPRMVAMFLSRKHTAASYSEIGKHFGGRNHSTAVAAEKKVRQWFDNDEELALGQRRVRVRELIERVERDLLR